MTEASTDLHADYQSAWKQRSRRDRLELTQAAMKGQRARNHEDAALSLWWIQRELRRGPRNALLWALGFLVFTIIMAWVVNGRAPADVRDLIAPSPFLPIFLLIPIWSTFTRRPRLRAAAQVNAAVLAGQTFNSPPDPEEAERLLRLARKEGWFRGTRPER